MRSIDFNDITQSLIILITKYNKMAFAGYDPDRFVGPQHQQFTCIICTNVVHEPCECHGCGKLFCKTCITNWSAKNSDVKCPNRCTVNQITPIFSKALQKIYNNLNIKCSNQKCQKVVALIDLPKHEAVCKLAKCWNYQICQTPSNEKIIGLKPCCSQLCKVVMELQEKFSDKKAVYETLGKFIVNVKSFGVAPHKVQSTGSIGGFGGLNTSVQLAWDPSKTGGGIALTESNTACFLKEQGYLFRTTIANYGFNGGVHYWEIVADNRTENELKIGVSTSNEFDFNSAFCDHPIGYAYYGLGQLRHGSNASGPAYGKKFKKDGVLGVFLNMNTGVLAFSLNGEYMGVAYKDSKLTKGPIYPAVALLHCAGCKIRSNLSVPSYFKD